MITYIIYHSNLQQKNHYSILLNVAKVLYRIILQSTSSRMRVINNNLSATKQRLHSQTVLSVAEISRHTVHWTEVTLCLKTL